MASTTTPRRVIPFPSAARREQLRERKAQTVGEARSRRRPAVNVGPSVEVEPTDNAVWDAIKAAENAQSKAIWDVAYSRSTGPDDFGRIYNEARDEHPDTVIWVEGKVVAIVRQGHGRATRHLWGRPD